MQATPAAPNDMMSAGPVLSWAATPVRTKIPVPMMAPTPRAERVDRSEHAPQTVFTLHLLQEHGERFFGEEVFH